MPAIRPALLKVQAAEIAELYQDPTAFKRALRDLLEFYADRTLRPGRVIESAPLLKSYKVPKPVLRQVEQALGGKINHEAEAALVLADALWQERWLESRFLAIDLLARVPPEPPERISQRVEAWGVECKEDIVVKALVTEATQRLRSEARPHFLSCLEGWLGSEEQPYLKLGLRSIPALLADESFENLPLLFRWIGPLVREVELGIKDDMAQVLRTLAQRSPQETAYFLRQALTTASSPHTASLIRRVLAQFPPSLQASLREALRGRW
jgi:hypothetical protein